MVCTLTIFLKSYRNKKRIFKFTIADVVFKAKVFITCRFPKCIKTFHNEDKIISTLLSNTIC